MDRIVLPTDFGNTVIIDGICYTRKGYTHKSPTHRSVDETCASCLDCPSVYVYLPCYSAPPSMNQAEATEPT